MPLPFLGEGKRFVANALNNVCWMFQYYRTIWAIKRTSVKPLRLPVFNKILILVPHADDELIGCFESVTTYCFGFTGEAVPHKNIQSRNLEIKDASIKLQFNLILSNENFYDELKGIIQEGGWDLICVPNLIDWHNDHLAVNHVLRKVLDELGEIKKTIQILSYQISVPFLEDGFTHYLPMDKQEQSLKWRVFRDVYKTQYNIPAFRFKLNERIAGQLIGLHAAELYSIAPFETYKEVLDAWQPIDRSILRTAINNISSVRKTIKTLRLKIG